jgi:hypothetical protein
VLTRRFGVPVRDINSGLRIIARDVFLHYAPAICDRFSLTSSITYGFLLDGRRIEYVPIEYRPRMGRTKVRPISYSRDFLKALATMRRFCRRAEPSAVRTTAGDSQQETA